MVYITCSRRYSDYFTKAIHMRQGSLRARSMVGEGCLSMRCAYTFQMQYNILQRRWCNYFLKAQAYVGRPAMDLLIATAVRVDGQHASTIAYDLYKLLGWRCVLKHRVPYSQLPKQRKRRNIPPSILPGCSWPNWYLQSTDSELFVFNQCTDTMVDDYGLLFTVAPGFSDLIWMITLETLFDIKCQLVQQC